MTLRDIRPRPTKEQARGKTRLYSAVHESACSFVSCTPRMHAFNFSTDLDDWPHLVGPRRGLSLDEHYLTWRRLPAHGARSESRQTFPFYSFDVNQQAQLMHLKTLAFTVNPRWTTTPEDTGNQGLRETLEAAFQLADGASEMTETEIEQD